jgi:hypothetical protein
MRSVKLPVASPAYGKPVPQVPWPELGGFDLQLQGAVQNIKHFRKPVWTGDAWRMSAEGLSEQWLATRPEERVRRAAARRPLDRIYRLGWTARQRELIPGPGYFYGIITQYAFHHGAQMLRYIVVGLPPLVQARGSWPGTATRPLLLPLDADLRDVTEHARQSHGRMPVVGGPPVPPDYADCPAAWRAEAVTYQIWADQLPRG